jgi:hypothetical protein
MGVLESATFVPDDLPELPSGAAASVLPGGASWLLGPGIFRDLKSIFNQPIVLRASSGLPLAETKA